MAGKGALRSIKNLAKGFSDVQIKVREATSNDPWGPSGTLMNEIAQLTFNESDFIEIMDMIDKRLNDKGKNWRHVFKALLLLDYCLHVGSENVVLYAKENIYVVKTLKEFQHLEENGKDVGANVRQKAKDISNLLVDDNRLKEERRQRQGMRDRMANIHDYLSESVRRINGELGDDDNSPNWDDENELKKALAESKRIADEDAKNKRQGDDDLEKALLISQQEAAEEKQKRQVPVNNPYQQPLQLEWTTSNDLFQPTTANNPYLQQQFNANGLQAQMTGFVPPPQQSTMDFFSTQQQPPLQAQMTGFPSFNNQTSFLQQQQQQPSFLQQQQQQQQQPTFLQQQQQQQQPTFLQQQQQPSFLQQQQQPSFLQPQASFQTSMVTGTNPFSQMTQQQPPPAIQQQHDYSGLIFGTTPQQQSVSSSPSSSTTPNFNFTTTTTQAATPTTFSPKPQPVSQHDSKYAKLNALLANKDDGMDTFGNQGNLRIPYGTGFAGSFKPTNTTTNDALFATQNKNPFGLPNQQNLPNNQPQKSLLDLMQEQKQQQQQSFF